MLINEVYRPNNRFLKGYPPALHGINDGNLDPLEIILDPKQVTIDLETRTGIYAEIGAHTGVPSISGLRLMPHPQPKDLHLPLHFASIWYHPKFGWSIYFQPKPTLPIRVVDMIETKGIPIEEEDYLFIKNGGQPGFVKNAGPFLGPAFSEEHGQEQKTPSLPDEYLKLDFGLRDRNN
ncbi:hypothetical protein GOV07_00170 [Candidatus Woesearchaeota archaeon]|nr:hypothetical protein [Candidatus Woesearchaeota archaeon]